MSDDSDRKQLDADQDHDRHAHAIEAPDSQGNLPGQRHLLGLERARLAIAGNDDYRLQFEADPTSFMQRFRATGPVSSSRPTPALIPAAVGSTPSGAHSDVKVGTSPIHGQGLFSGRGVRSGEVVGRVMNDKGDDVSPMASKVNNSDRPNAMPVMQGGEMVLKAVSDVPAGQEVLSNYPFPK
jgi:hypothetical protein